MPVASKSVLFHYPVLNRGGAEMSTLRMLTALCDRGWKTTLVLTTGGGPLEPQIDPRVEVIRLRDRPTGEQASRARTLAEAIRALPDFVSYLRSRFQEAHRTRTLGQRSFQAAAVLFHGTSSELIRKHVKARRRIHWIRNDLAHVDPDGRLARRFGEADASIDHYVCVSEIARLSLLSVVPGASGKTTTVYNILNTDGMRALAQGEPDPFPEREGDEVRILTVCRLSDRAKGLLRMVRVAKRLVDQGHRFHWFVVGEGDDRVAMVNAIQAAGLAGRMTVLGAKSNPFPYFAHCDLVAMLSYYEGLCGVINEAKALGRPVLATRVAGIDEQIVPFETGIVVENEEDAIVAGLHSLLSDRAHLWAMTNSSLPAALEDDGAKLDMIEAIFLTGETGEAG